MSYHGISLSIGGVGDGLLINFGRACWGVHNSWTAGEVA